MTSRIARNTFYNLAGGVAPMALVLVTVPLYLHKIGDARYGVLAIVWLWTGYFSLLDLGLSRATTHQLAQLHDAPPRDRQSLFWTALLLNGVLGLVGAMALWGAGDLVVTRLLKMPDDLRAEVLGSLPWIAASVPMSTLGGVLNGTLEARGRFLQLNLIQLAGSTLFQLIPLAVAYQHGPDLSWLIPAAILSKLVAFLPLLAVALWSLPVTTLVGPSRRWIRRLYAYGGWITVTNLLGTLVTSLDQVLVGSLLGVREVAWYNVPFNMLWRLMVFPTAFLRVLFPVFSKGDAIESLDMANRSLRFIGVAFLPLIVAATIVLKPFLSVWTGQDFALQAAPVGLILLPGIWLNAIGSVPLSLIQASGRPSLVVRILLIETVPFIALLWLSLQLFGVEGAAWAWTFRNLVYAVTFIWLCPIEKAYVFALWPAALSIGAAWTLATLAPFYTAEYVLGAGLLFATTLMWCLWREPRLARLVTGMPGSLRYIFR